MSAIDNGGPAFPIPGLQHDEYFNGMSLRDYFIAHAPVAPQPWFQPVMPERPADVWKADHGNWTYLSAEAAEKECGDLYHNVNQKEIDAWNAERAKQFYVQWPAAWADEMLKARQA